MNRLSVPLLLLLLLLLLAPVITAQDDACPTIVQTALNTTASACEGTGRNQACYGNVLIDTTPQEGTILTFADSGDIINVADMASMQLYPLDETDQTWGVSVMKIQANIPDTMPGQNVTFVLFGDVEIENAAGEQAALSTVNVSATGVNLRTGPSTSDAVAGTLNGTLEADGRLEDGSWLRVRLPDSAEHVWVASFVVTVDGDASTLAVVDPADTGAAFGPMQAFYFRAGVGDSPCETAPDSGLLIQTPEGAGEVALNVNGVNFSFGSTGYLYGWRVDQAMGSYPDYPPFGLAMMSGTAQYNGTNLHAGWVQPFAYDGTGYFAWGDPYAYNPMDYANLPFGLLPSMVYPPQWGTLTSSGYDIVYHQYMPPAGVEPNHCVAMLFHTARGNMHEWDSWMVPPLVNDGWSVWTPNMPDPWSPWVPIGSDAVNDLHDTYGYNCYLFGGSSIGANVALQLCNRFPRYCMGAVLLSPGIKYTDQINMLGAMANVNVPVYIASETSLQGDAQALKEVGGDKVTVTAYNTNLHGSAMSQAFDVWGDLAGFFAGLAGPTSPE